ncbi:MAG: hypothetical protein RI993_175 [Pseudomonadota bacterium]|nr:penicillin-binding protein activator [Nitrosomonas sp.]
MKNLLRCCLVWLLSSNIYISASANQPNEEFLSNTIPSHLGGHFALLLPFDSPTLRQAAFAVQKGFENAARLEPDFIRQIIPYPTDDKASSVLSAYQQAVDDGAHMIIGPLTRDSVDTLVLSHLISLPTLALNYPTNKMASLSAQLFFFGINIESEAQYIAKMAAASGKYHAVILVDRSELSKRLKAAFADAWLKTNPDFSAEEMEISFREKLSVLSGHNHKQDHIIFLALNSFNSESVRSLIHPSTPIYATSLVFGNKDPAYVERLEAVRFIDMPWLIQPELAPVQHYHSPNMPTDISLQRFYALGIDAFQLAQKILEYRSPETIVLDGVSGFIHPSLPGHFNRRLIPAIFKKGNIVPDN